MKKDNHAHLSPVWLVTDTNVVTAGTTRRAICCDTGNPYAGFSVCHYTGDNPRKVSSCRTQLAWLTSNKRDRIVIPWQTHSVNVHTVTPANLNDIYPADCDALVTSVPDIMIGVNTADCVPVLMYDPINLVVGAAHAGWRGAVNGILRNTIQAMCEIGAHRNALHAIICPAIGVECFEVGEEVACLFPEKFVNRNYSERPHIDLPGYVKYCLVQGGVPVRNIQHTDICTRCNYTSYFSARKLGINSGRNFSFIRLNGGLRRTPPVTLLTPDTLDGISHHTPH